MKPFLPFSLIIFSLALFDFSYFSKGYGSNDRGTGLGASHIVINLEDPNIMYVSSTFYGIYKTEDGGKSWNLVNKGLGASDFYTIALNPKNPQILLVGAAGGGIYKSKNGGQQWKPANKGLTDTSVYDIVFDPGEKSTVYALTLREIFVSQNNGDHWKALFKENPRVMDPTFHRRLLVLSGEKKHFFVATEEHGYQRGEGDKEWRPLENDLSGLKVTAFAFDASSNAVYVGSKFGDGLYRKKTGEDHWTRIGKELKKAWVHRILVDPFNPDVIYLATHNFGMLKSMDGGIHWSPINHGLTEIGIKALAAHPKRSGSFWIATYGQGLFTSTDHGEHWVHRKVPVYPTWEALGASLTRQAQGKSPPSPPPSFSKCQHCHAWTDPILNGTENQTFWRVFPSRRDWTETIKRMRPTAQLSETEEKEILKYLNTYYGSE